MRVRAHMCLLCVYNNLRTVLPTTFPTAAILFISEGALAGTDWQVRLGGLIFATTAMVREPLFFWKSGIANLRMHATTNIPYVSKTAPLSACNRHLFSPRRLSRATAVRDANVECADVRTDCSYYEIYSTRFE
jgi:hypothetical protein